MHAYVKGKLLKGTCWVKGHTHFKFRQALPDPLPKGLYKFTLLPTTASNAWFPTSEPARGFSDFDLGWASHAILEQFELQHYITFPPT